jgi:hypothetical protein
VLEVCRDFDFLERAGAVMAEVPSPDVPRRSSFF